MKTLLDSREQNTPDEALVMLQVSFAHAARSIDHFLAIAPELVQPVVEQPAAPVVAPVVAPQPAPQPTPVEAQPATLTEAYALRQVAEAHNNETAVYPVELWSSHEDRTAA